MTVSCISWNHFTLKFQSKADKVFSLELLVAPFLSVLGCSAVVYGDKLTFGVHKKLSPTFSFNSFENKIVG